MPKKAKAELKKQVEKSKWAKLWYLNGVFGIWLLVGFIVILAETFCVGDAQPIVSPHYLVGIPGYALTGEMFALVGFKGFTELKKHYNKRKEV